MLNKIAPLAGLLALTALCASPVKAEPQDSPLLISQLRGHQTYKGLPQLNMSDYVVGRVRGASGGILSIEFLKPVTVDGKEMSRTDFSVGGTRVAASDVKPGDDVILRIVEDDGKFARYEFVGLARPYWITRLKLKSEGATNANTSQLLQELNETRAWGLPALPPENRTYSEVAPTPAPEPAAAPVRGLW